MTPRLPLAPTALLACAGAFVAGCSHAPSGQADVTVTFRFADGRGCADAGVLQVQATSSATIACEPATCLYLCADGEAGGVPLTVPLGGATVDLAALSVENDPLYRATLVLPQDPPAFATALFRFTGGE